MTDFTTRMAVCMIAPHALCGRYYSTTVLLVLVVVQRKVSLPWVEYTITVMVCEEARRVWPKILTRAELPLWT